MKSPGITYIPSKRMYASIYANIEMLVQSNGSNLSICIYITFVSDDLWLLYARSFGCLRWKNIFLFCAIFNKFHRALINIIKLIHNNINTRTFDCCYSSSASISLFSCSLLLLLYLPQNVWMKVEVYKISFVMCDNLAVDKCLKE